MTNKSLKIGSKIMLLAMAFCLPVSAQAMHSLASRTTRLSPFLARVGRQTAETLKQPHGFFQAAIRQGVAKSGFSRLVAGSTALAAGGLASSICLSEGSAQEKKRGLLKRPWGQEYGDLTPEDGEFFKKALIGDVKDVEQKMAAELQAPHLTPAEWDLLEQRMKSITSSREESIPHSIRFIKVLGEESNSYWETRKRIINLTYEINKRNIEARHKKEGDQIVAFIGFTLAASLAAALATPYVIDYFYKERPVGIVDQQPPAAGGANYWARLGQGHRLRDL